MSSVDTMEKGRKNTKRGKERGNNSLFFFFCQFFYLSVLTSVHQLIFVCSKTLFLVKRDADLCQLPLKSGAFNTN